MLDFSSEKTPCISNHFLAVKLNKKEMGILLEEEIVTIFLETQKIKMHLRKMESVVLKI